MWKNNSIILRSLIWLTTLMMPIHGLLAKCSVLHNSPTNGCECRRTAEDGSGCCSNEKLRMSCCSTPSRGACECGANCRCGQENPSIPMAPLPTEDHPTVKVANALAGSGAFTVVARPPQPSQRPGSTSSTTSGLAATERCVSLCRFTL